MKCSTSTRTRWYGDCLCPLTIDADSCSSQSPLPGKFAFRQNSNGKRIKQLIVRRVTVFDFESRMNMWDITDWLENITMAKNNFAWGQISQTVDSKGLRLLDSVLCLGKTRRAKQLVPRILNLCRSMQENSLNDNGHSSNQDVKKSGSQREHTNLKSCLLKSWCLISEKVDSPCFEDQVRWTEELWKAKEVENCRYDIVVTQALRELIFRTIASVSQLSIYGAVSELVWRAWSANFRIILWRVQGGPAPKDKSEQWWHLRQCQQRPIHFWPTMQSRETCSDNTDRNSQNFQMTIKWRKTCTDAGLMTSSFHNSVPAERNGRPQRKSGEHEIRRKFVRKGTFFTSSGTTDGFENSLAGSTWRSSARRWKKLWRGARGKPQPKRYSKRSTWRVSASRWGKSHCRVRATSAEGEAETRLWEMKESQQETDENRSHVEKTRTGHEDVHSKVDYRSQGKHHAAINEEDDARRHQQTGLPNQESSKQGCVYRRFAARSALWSFQWKSQKKWSTICATWNISRCSKFLPRYSVIIASSTGHWGFFTVRAVHD